MEIKTEHILAVGALGLAGFLIYWFVIKPPAEVKAEIKNVLIERG